MKKHIMYFVLLLCVSCTSNRVDNIELSENIIKTAKTLEVDSIISDDRFPNTRYFYYYNDSIIVLLNNRRENACFLQFYNKQADTIVSQLFVNGKGPKEFLSANMQIKGSKVFVSDCVTQKLAIVDIDDLMKDKNYNVVIDKSVKFGNSSFSQFHGQYVFENPYCFVDEKEGIVQEEDRLLSVDEMNNLDKKEHKYNTRNVSSCGHIITNDSKDCVMYASSGQSFIELYDRELRLIKRITGPKDLDVKYSLSEESPTEVVYSKKVPYTYMGYCVSKNYVFFNYIGEFLEGPDYSTNSMKSHILQFDWDGNLINCYNTNYYITSLSCDYNSNTIDGVYANIIDGEGRKVLVRFHEKK